MTYLKNTIVADQHHPDVGLFLIFKIQCSLQFAELGFDFFLTEKTSAFFFAKTPMTSVQILKTFGRQKNNSTRWVLLFFLVAELGFEPRQTESESAVLPLHNSAKKWCERRELNPYDEITRPLNVRVCQFRHSRIPFY